MFAYLSEFVSSCVWHSEERPNENTRSRYRAWRITFWMFYGGAAYAGGFITRSIFANNPSNKDLYMAQYILILCGPPIYSAAEYNVLARSTSIFVLFYALS